MLRRLCEVDSAIKSSHLGNIQLLSKFTDCNIHGYASQDGIGRDERRRWGKEGEKREKRREEGKNGITEEIIQRKYIHNICGITPIPLIQSAS